MHLLMGPSGKFINKIIKGKDILSMTLKRINIHWIRMVSPPFLYYGQFSIIIKSIPKAWAIKTGFKKFNYLILKCVFKIQLQPSNHGGFTIWRLEDQNTHWSGLVQL